MTYGELHNLIKNSKHEKIGSVSLYMNLSTRKCDEIEVVYKEGKRFCHKGECPKTVKEFLKQQNYHISRITPNKKHQIVTYFMT